MSPETRLTEEERLDWESQKYGPRVVTVYVLDSQRILIAHPGLTVHSVHDGWRTGGHEGFVDELLRIKEEPLPEYLPPKARSLVKAPLMSDEELSAALTELEDLKIDL